MHTNLWHYVHINLLGTDFIQPRRPLEANFPPVPCSELTTSPHTHSFRAKYTHHLFSMKLAIVVLRWLRWTGRVEESKDVWLFSTNRVWEWGSEELSANFVFGKHSSGYLSLSPSLPLYPFIYIIHTTTTHTPSTRFQCQSLHELRLVSNKFTAALHIHPSLILIYNAQCSTLVPSHCVVNSQYQT